MATMDDCNCMIPYLEGVGQHSPGCSIFNVIEHEEEVNQMSTSEEEPRPGETETSTPQDEERAPGTQPLQDAQGTGADALGGRPDILGPTGSEVPESEGGTKPEDEEA